MNIHETEKVIQLLRWNTSNTSSQNDWPVIETTYRRHLVTYNLHEAKWIKCRAYHPYIASSNPAGAFVDTIWISF